jgi:signal transduction histidine kinase
MRSPLVTRCDDYEKLRAQGRAILKDAARVLRGEESAQREAEGELYESIGTWEARESVHPRESLRAVAALSEAALSVVAENLPPSRSSRSEVVGVAVALSEGIMRCFTRASVSYIDYLLRKGHESQIEERRRIGHELHDRLAPSLNFILRNLELHKALEADEPSWAEEKRDLALIHAEHALKLVGELTTELRSSEAGEGLEVAVSNLLDTAVPPEIDSWVSIKGDGEPRLPPHVRDQLFLIVREAVRNAVAHSGAQNIRVELNSAPDRVTLEVWDDGCGFDPAEVRPQVSTGLNSMRERTSFLGGTFRVLSAPASGTRVEVSVPLDRGWV